MTENEVIKICNTMIFAASLSNPQGTPLNMTKEELTEAMGMAIKALEEVQQYRAIGTTEELQTAMKYVRLAKKHGTIGQVIEECVEYEAIGTLEVCQKSVEICKAIIDRGIELEDVKNYVDFEDKCVKKGFIIKELLEAEEKQTAKKPITYEGTNRADCPVCGKTVRGISKHWGNWCSHCGQKLDWEDKE